MSAQFRILAADQQTPITTLNLGNILTPGSSSNVKVYLNNFGDQMANNVSIAIAAVAGNDGSLYGFLAADNSGVPGPFGAGPLVVGNVASMGMYPFWTDVQTIAGLDPSNNPRRYTIVASGTST